MQPPRTLKELRGLQSRLTYIWRFITNLSGCCQSFTQLMKKGVPFIWYAACQKVFEDIKEFLTMPPVLVAPISGKSFLLYMGGPHLRRSSGTKEWWRHRTSHLLPEQNSDQSWILIQPCREEVSHSCLCCPKDTTLFGWPNHACHFRSQSPAYSHDEARVLELQTSLLGHSAISVWHDFCPLKGGQRSSFRRFSGILSSFVTSKLHIDIPDKVVKANMTSGDDVWQVLWRCIKNRPYRQGHCCSGGGIRQVEHIEKSSRHIFTKVF